MIGAAALLEPFVSLTGRFSLTQVTVGIALVCATMFGATFARRVATILADTYTVRVTDSVVRWLAQCIVVLGAAMSRRRRTRFEVVEEALSTLDNYAADPRTSDWLLLIRAVEFGWSAPVTADYRRILGASRITPARRIFDIAFSGTALAIFLPALAIIALVVALDMGRPIFFRRTRVGSDGLHFHQLQFRTCRLSFCPECPTPHFVPSSSKIGNLLRHSGIDVLPEFVNVFKGDMTLVGPAPGLPTVDDDRPRSTPGLIYPPPDGDEDHPDRSLRSDLKWVRRMVADAFRARPDDSDESG